MEQYFWTIVNEIYNGDNDMNQVEFAEKFWEIHVDLATENITISKTIVQHPYMRNEWAYDVLSEHIQNEFLLKCCLAEFDSEFCDKLAEHIADKLIWTNTDFILERARLESSTTSQ